MNAITRSVLLVALVVVPLCAARARIERTIEKSFTVTRAGTLHLETQGGEIRVAPGADGTVKVTARERIRADTDAEADELLKKLDLSFAQNGDDVSAVAKYERQIAGFHSGSWPPVHVDFFVTVPAAFATDLHTSGGNITVGELGGKVHARTSGGSIKLGNIGAEIDVHTSGGSVTLAGARGPVRIGTSGGSISVGRVAGPAELSTSGGGIAIDSVEGQVNAHTSGGSIRAGISGALKDDCTLSTSGGSVRVTVDRTAAFRLDASTSGGSVRAEGLTLTLDGGKVRRNHLEGVVNGGGPTLKLRSSGGDVSVQPR